MNPWERPSIHPNVASFFQTSKSLQPPLPHRERLAEEAYGYHLATAA